jgi:hypothetical protein
MTTKQSKRELFEAWMKANGHPLAQLDAISLGIYWQQFLRTLEI